MGVTVEPVTRATSQPEDEAKACTPEALCTRGEEMMGSAIAVTLQAPPPERAALFETLAAEIMAVTTGPHSGRRPWKYTVHDGTDGSRSFRGGVWSSGVN